MKAFLAYLPSVACIGFAGAIILMRGSEATGWGWFLFLAVIMYPEAWEVIKS